MTRKRKGLAPLSQRGLNRIPHNPNQRGYSEGGVKANNSGALEAYNDTLEGRTLHPTKGFRRVSEKRVFAQLTIAQITFRKPKLKVGAQPNRYMPHIGAKERARRAGKPDGLMHRKVGA